jgi:hypothetical protein
LGVPLGVPVGVGPDVSILAFLDDDLGVMFDPRKDLTGVEISSFVEVFGVTFESVGAVPRRNRGDREGDPEPAMRGVSGALCALLPVLRLGINGRD